jgi:hypothetical protein
MSILQFPQGVEFPATFVCPLCSRQISPADATIGPINGKEQATILCNGHLWDGRQLINMLADYLAEERNKLVVTIPII